MNSINRDCFTLAASVRGFGLLSVVVAMLGCSDQVQEQPAVTEQSTTPIEMTAPAIAAPTASPSANTEVNGSSDSSIEITIEIGVPEEAMGALLPSSRLFVIAKSSAGPMPLAVKAFPIDAIPSSVSLSDADAMMPNRLLSSADELIVTARISRAGGAIRAPGDWEGIAAEPKPERPSQYQIRIDQPVN